jgi:mono/diheme cytochrome c family protein
MKSMHARLVVAFFIVGLLSAYGAQVAQKAAATSQPAAAVIVPTQTLIMIPAFTNTAEPTEAPTAEPAAQVSAVSFANDVFPILQSRCINCHGGNRTEEGLSLKTYAEIMKGSQNGLVISAGDANNSLLAELISDQKMPKRGPKLTPPQIQLIIDWINQGALDN